MAIHDNSTEMWDRYYAAERGAGLFDRLIHWGRETYFGALFARRVVKLGGPATSYLELGVGTAQTLSRLQKMTRVRCVGIEKTPRAYEMGKAYAPNCELVLGDGLALPFPDKSFDAAYSLGLHEHFEPPEQERLLREQARVARNVVLVEVPTRTPHMMAVMWFNRNVLKKKGVWADDELFSPARFRAKYPGLPYHYFFDWASGGMTCWFALKPDDIQHWLTHRGSDVPPSKATGRTKREWWTMGAFIVAGLAAWLPYWAWNVLSGTGGFRVPVMTPGVFDSYVYLHWMAGAANSIAYGGHLKWFGSLVIAPLWKIMHSWASYPELWIVSRWIAMTVTLWIGPWCVRRWSGLDRRSSRIIVGGLWLSLLPLSLRPGVYSWYLPFCLLGLVLVLPVLDDLKQGRYVRAAILSLVSIFLTSLYPWFLLVAGVWLATIWAVRFIRLGSWIFPSAITLTLILLWLYAGPFARWFLDPAQAGLVGMYERNGMTFARVPFFANTVLAIGAWIAFLFSCARSQADAESRERITFAAWGWIVVLFLWFNTPFTGISIYSDHFIAPTAVLAWLSLATVWSVRGTGDSHAGTGVIKHVPIIVALGATLFFLYVLQQPIRFNMMKFDSYVIHLTQWFALSLAAWLVALRTRPNISLWIILPTLGMGLAGTIPVIIRDLPLMAKASANVPVIDWIRHNVPPTDMMCADPETASFFSAHAGNRVNPAEATLSYPDSSERVIQNLETLAGAYAVTSSGQGWFFRFYTDHYRTIPCAEGSKYSHNAGWFGLLRWLGFDVGNTIELIGCRQSAIDANWSRVSAAIERHALDGRAFGELCPWAIIPIGQRQYWSLPGTYRESWSDDRISVWKNS